MTNRYLTVILAAAIFALVFVGLMSALRSAQAATIEAKPKNKTIEIKGLIEEKDFDRFSAKLGAYPETQTIVLNSTGGSVREGYRISRLLRLFELATIIPAGQTCGSACVMIWAAGFPRQLGAGANLYVHCAYYRKTRVCDSKATQAMTDYLKTLKMPQEAIDSMLKSQKASDKILVRRTDDLIRTKEISRDNAEWLIEVGRFIADKSRDIVSIKAWQDDACVYGDANRCNAAFERVRVAREWEKKELIYLKTSVENRGMDQQTREQLVTFYNERVKKADVLWGIIAKTFPRGKATE
jgi:ATP-dependent protease ClpP protease subunit